MSAPHCPCCGDRTTDGTRVACTACDGGLAVAAGDECFGCGAPVSGALLGYCVPCDLPFAPPAPALVIAHAWLVADGVSDADLRDDRILLPAAEGCPAGVVTWEDGAYALRFPGSPDDDSTGLPTAAALVEALFAV